MHSGIDDQTGHPFFTCLSGHWHGSRAAASECCEFAQDPNDWGVLLAGQGRDVQLVVRRSDDVIIGGVEHLKHPPE